MLNTRLHCGVASLNANLQGLREFILKKCKSDCDMFKSISCMSMYRVFTQYEVFLSMIDPGKRLMEIHGSQKTFKITLHNIT